MTQPPAISPTRRLFTVKDYHAMQDAGILTEEDRVELIEGEIIPLSPIKSPHAACVDVLNEWLIVQYAGKAIVHVQNPVTLFDYSEPEPNIVLAKYTETRYRDGHPGAEDILLLIEVSDSSLEKDRPIKLPLYAKAAIPEVWIVNLVDGQVEICTDPSPDGYNAIRIVRRGHQLDTPWIRGLRVDDLLG